MNFAVDPINTIENLIAKNRSKTLSLYFVVVVTLLILIVSLPNIYVDISSQSRGIVKSIKENTPITSIVSGKIIYTNLKSNKIVNYGDTLITISIDNLEAEKVTNIELLNTLKKTYQDLDLILSDLGNYPATPFIRDEYIKFVAQKTELESRLSLAKLKYDRHKFLYDEKVIAKAEYETYLFDMKYAEQALNSLIKQYFAQWQNQKNDLFLQIKNIEGIIERIDVQKENYYIISPISGTVENFIGIQSGSYINSGQPIAEVSPDDDLIVESAVSPNDIGLIKVGQNVKFQIDAFNYFQWGLSHGKVLDIDRNITIDNNIGYFKVRCSVNSLEMKLKSGYSTKITKGMTLTSRFMITRRSLYQLLFDKVDDWLNPKLKTSKQ